MQKLLKTYIKYYNVNGKVIKSDIQYRLHNEHGLVIATSTNGKLSFKNCQAIERSYDLDQSLQQTEWDVEIVEEKVYDGLDEMAQPQYVKQPKLDADGCLILKRINSETDL